jgi:hypothetical protein
MEGNDVITNEEIAALIPTLSERPRHYYDLIRKLVADGFKYDHREAEFYKVETNGRWSGMVRGRICWTPNRAWLRHRDNAQSHHVGTDPALCPQCNRTYHFGDPATFHHLPCFECREKDLPVPVLRESEPERVAEPETSAVTIGEARESNRTISLAAEGRKETADSRGGQTDLDGTPLPEGWPEVAQQHAYWDQLPEYECPKCGEWHKVASGQDEVHCQCGAVLSVSRDGETCPNRDLTTLILKN